MKVLSVVKALGLGGTERAAKNYAALYHEIGYESAILSFSDNYSPIEWLDRYRIHFFFKLEGNSKFENKELVDKLIAYAPDIVHIHNNGIQKKDLSDWLALLTPRPLVLETCHFPLMADYFDYVDIHLQLSHWCLWQFYCTLRRENKAYNKDVYVLPHVVDHSAFLPSNLSEKVAIRKKLRIPENAFVFGRIAQPYFDKWSWLIFDAFQDIAKKNSHAYLLLIALPEEYKSYIKKLSCEIQERIIVREASRDPAILRGYYQCMDVFLHAANQGETFGMVLAEAMLCEIPVISLFTPYRDNSQLEVTGFGRGGIIVSNRISMKKAMQLLMIDKEKYNELGKQGRKWVLEQYSPEALRTQLQNIIKKGLNKNNNSAKWLSHSANYRDSQKEVRRQLRLVYGWRCVLHLPMLALLGKTKEPLHGKIVYLQRLLLGHISWRIFWDSLLRNFRKLYRRI